MASQYCSASMLPQQCYNQKVALLMEELAAHNPPMPYTYEQELLDEHASLKRFLDELVANGGKLPEKSQQKKNYQEFERSSDGLMAHDQKVAFLREEFAAHNPPVPYTYDDQELLDEQARLDRFLDELVSNDFMLPEEFASYNQKVAFFVEELSAHNPPVPYTYDQELLDEKASLKRFLDELVANGGKLPEESQQQKHYQEFERSVDELMAYDAIMTKKLKKIATRPENEGNKEFNKLKNVVPRQNIITTKEEMKEKFKPKKVLVTKPRKMDVKEDEDDEEEFEMCEVYYAMKQKRMMRVTAKSRHIVRRR